MYHHVWARRVDIRAEQGLVSFSFDDAPLSAVDAGAAILAACGWRATYYVSAGLLGRDSEVGRLMGEAELARCAGQGHEIASHTYSHVSCPELGRAALLEECRRGVAALAGFAPRNFAYPFGASDLRVQRLLGPRFDSCRGIEPGINALATDLNDLKANAVYSGRGLDRQLELIEENRGVRGWLIFYTHDVRPEPSRFGTTPQDLERLATAVRRAGLRVTTVRGALEELRRQRPAQ